MSSENIYSFLVKNTSEENREVSLLDNQDKDIIIIPIDDRYNFEETKERMKDLVGNVTIRVVDSNPYSGSVRNCVPANTPIYHTRNEDGDNVFQYLYFELDAYQFQGGIIDILAQNWNDSSNVRFSLKGWTRMTVHILQTPDNALSDKPVMEVKEGKNPETESLETTIPGSSISNITTDQPMNVTTPKDDALFTLTNTVEAVSAEREGSNNIESTNKPNEAETADTPVIDINRDATKGGDVCYDGSGETPGNPA